MHEEVCSIFYMTRLEAGVDMKARCGFLSQTRNPTDEPEPLDKRERMVLSSESLLGCDLVIGYIRL